MASAAPPFELHAAAAAGDVSLALQVVQKQRAEELAHEKRKGPRGSGRAVGRRR